MIKEFLQKVWDKICAVGRWIKSHLIETIIGGTAVVLVAQVFPTPIPLTPSIIDNGRVIEFAYTDDNTGEDLIIRTNQERYFNIAGGFTVHYSILNNSNQGQEVKVAFSLSDDTATKKIVRNIRQYIGESVKYVDVYSSSTNTTTTEEIKNAIWEEKEWKDFNVVNPNSFIRKELKKTHANKSNTFYLDAGEIRIFKAEIKYLPEQLEEEFFIEAFGNKGSYGHLDPWTYEQLFNAGSDQTLHGYDSWVISQGTLNINTAVPYEGVRSVQITNTGETYAYRDISAVETGTVYFALQSAATNQYTNLQLWDGANMGWYVDMNIDGNIYFVGDASKTLKIGYSANVWYVFAIEFTGGDARAKMYESGSWGAWSDWVGFQTGRDNVTRIKWAGYRPSGSVYSYFDTITPNDPTVVVSRRIMDVE